MQEKTKNNFFMPNHVGHQVKSEIFGHMHQEIQISYEIVFQTSMMVHHHLNDLLTRMSLP